MNNRTKSNQAALESGIKNQKEYIRLRHNGKSQAISAKEVGISLGSAFTYEAMYELWCENERMVNQWWEDWRNGVPVADNVPKRAYSYLAARRREARKAAKSKHSNAGQAGPMPTFTPAEIPARASLATIDELRTELARWRGKSKAAYNLITNEDFIVKLEQFIDSAVEVVTVVRKIMDLLDTDKEGNDE